MARTAALVAALLLALLALLAPRPASAAERRWVLVIANNRSLTGAVAPLRYADDDGVRWYELLAPTARRISLFSVLDEESQSLFRDVASRAEAPNRKAVLARLAEYNVEMRAARAAGDEPVLFLVIIGHGEVGPDGEGFVSLLDAPLGRAELFRDVLAPSTASFNHLIIDACNAYLLVARRGDDRGPSRASAIRRWVADEDLQRYPTTGVMLSTSRAQATHEWSVYGGGIFSQQLRSALAGAADVNGDGRVEYSEVAAYVAAANLRVDDPRARLDVFVRPPAQSSARPLADLGSARYSHYLRLPTELAGRYFLEDARGVRYADFNKSPERPLVLALVDSSYYYLRNDAEEARLRIEKPGMIDLRPSWFQRRAIASRGAIEESFRRHLFEVPFGPGFYRGHVASIGGLAVAEHAKAFVPPPVVTAAADGAALERRLGSARLRQRRSDSYATILVDWCGGRLRQGDLREAERALLALEHHLDETRTP